MSPTTTMHASNPLRNGHPRAYLNLPSSTLLYSAWKLRDLCYAQTIPLSEVQMVDKVSETARERERDVEMPIPPIQRFTALMTYKLTAIDVAAH